MSPNGCQELSGMQFELHTNHLVAFVVVRACVCSQVFGVVWWCVCCQKLSEMLPTSLQAVRAETMVDGLPRAVRWLVKTAGISVFQVIFLSAGEDLLQEGPIIYVT